MRFKYLAHLFPSRRCKLCVPNAARQTIRIRKFMCRLFLRSPRGPLYIQLSFSFSFSRLAQATCTPLRFCNLFFVAVARFSVFISCSSRAARKLRPGGGGGGGGGVWLITVIFLRGRARKHLLVRFNSSIRRGKKSEMACAYRGSFCSGNCAETGYIRFEECECKLCLLFLISHYFYLGSAGN